MAYNYVCTFDLQECLKTLGLDEKGRVQQYVTEEVMRLSEPYVPFDVAGKYPHAGLLKNSAHIEDDVDIVWKTPYARRWYYEDANFQGAPTRGRLWVDRMMQNGGQKKIEEGARREARK